LTFENKFQDIKEQLDGIRLNVLVWGPGDSGGPSYEKRMKIREKLRDSFRNADIRFSEELDLGKLFPSPKDLLAHEQELYHLAACDACIVLDASKGAGEEIAHFSSSKYAYKLCILTHEKYKDSSSFPTSVRKHLHQIFYTDEEYNACSLIDRAVTRVRQTAFGKMTDLFV